MTQPRAAAAQPTPQPTPQLPSLSLNRVLCSNDLGRRLRDGVPTVVRDAVAADVVAAVEAAVARGAGSPLAPFPGENIASQERNGNGAAASAAALLAGVCVGQLRLEAPALAAAAVRRLLAGAGRAVHGGDSLAFVNSRGMRRRPAAETIFEIF